MESFNPSINHLTTPPIPPIMILKPRSEDAPLTYPACTGGFPDLVGYLDASMGLLCTITTSPSGILFFSFPFLFDRHVLSYLAA
jgi:hypothetical protein